MSKLFFNHSVDKKIRIINEESDIEKEYSFSELIEFTKIIIEVKKTYLKKNISSIDLFGSNITSHSNGNLLGLSTPPQGADAINIDPISPAISISTIKENSNNSNNSYIQPQINVSNGLIKSNFSSGNLNGLGIINTSNSSTTNLIQLDTSSTSNSDSPFSSRASQIISPLHSSNNYLSPNQSSNQLLKDISTSIRTINFHNRAISSNKQYWVDLEGLNPEELSALCKLFSIHPLTLEDMMSGESTEKCEEHSNYIFISTSEPSYSKSGELTQVPVFMLIFGGLIITIHPCDLACFPSIIKSFSQHLDCGESLPSAEWVMGLFFEAFNETYAELMYLLMNEVRVLEDFTLREEVVHQELYTRLGKATRKSTNLLSFIFIKNDILSNLVRQNQSKETKLYLSSIKDQALRIKQRLKLTEELLENINTVYISKISLLLNEEAHALNMSMRTFTALTLIFLPLSFIAGVFGMNIHVPGFQEESFGVFIGILLSMLIIGATLFIYFRKLKWI